MNGSTPLIWLRRLIVVGAVVAGATASAAGALIPNPDGNPLPASTPLISRPPDVQDAATARHAAAARLQTDSAALHTTAAGLTADGLRWQGITQVYQQLQAAPDLVERYAATHSAGTGTPAATSVASRPPDVQDASDAVKASAPDVFERYAGVHANDVTSSTAPTRPPDVSDAALVARYAPASTGQSDGFDWSSWAIGIGSGLGLVLIAGAALLMSRQLRHRVQTA
jgi:hypothetical protein